VHLPRVYPITDRVVSGLTIAEQVGQLAAAGARLIQIREKSPAVSGCYADAKEAVAVARQAGAAIIVNDRVDLAMLLEADGVHLGQSDLSPIHARRLLGPDAIIGFSTHNEEQVRAALELPVDYIAFGPVFTTSTKADPDPVTGIERLGAVRRISDGMPLVAIGGIGITNIASVIAAGADSAAVISSVLAGPAALRDNFRSLDAAACNA
jgi:thiamine-phosphate pyrophosphorylase